MQIAIALLAYVVVSLSASADITVGPGADVTRQDAKSALEADPAMEYSPTSIFVRFAPYMDHAMQRQVLDAVGGAVVLRYTLVPGLMLVDPGVSVEHAVEVLGAMPGVIYSEFDLVYRLDDVPNDPLFGLQWGLQNRGQFIAGVSGTAGADIGAVEAWNEFTGEASFPIAVLDSGVQWSHPDLAANIWINPGEVAGNGVDDDNNGFVDDIRGWDFYSNNNNPMDLNGHGTHVAGTIGAAGNNGVGVTGVAWQCSIVPLRVAGPNGLFASDVIRALQYCTAMNIRVSNNSWSSRGYSAAIFDAISAMIPHGHIFVCAAGNEGIDIDRSPRYPASYNLPNMITVAATGSRDLRAAFTNIGPSQVHLGAPGVEIYSTALGGRYAFRSGTSMAAPHVAGVVALIYAQNPSWTFTQVRERVLGTVRPVAALNGRTVTGGVVNLAAAIMPAADVAPRQPEGVQVVNLGSRSARVAWVDASTNEIGFEIQRETRWSNLWIGQIIIGSAGQNQTVFVDASALGRHRYRVRAYNDAGASAWSPWRVVDVTE
ncbi:MAG: S8 family serine peptidase [Phycisphaeraceae bacterium]|nr:S8 family serine peptidase [Phycisphaeraceae bacterium]